MDRWIGPGTILESPGTVINCKKIDINGDQIMVNVKNIKPYYRRPDWMTVDIPMDDLIFAKESTRKL